MGKDVPALKIDGEDDKDNERTTEQRCKIRRDTPRYAEIRRDTPRYAKPATCNVQPCKSSTRLVSEKMGNAV